MDNPEVMDDNESISEDSDSDFDDENNDNEDDDNADDGLFDNSSDDEEDIPLQVRWNMIEEFWLWEEGNNFTPIVHEFTDEKAGLQMDCGLTENSSILDIFEYFYDSDVVEMICAMSNIYRSEIITSKQNAGTLKPKSRVLLAGNLTESELYIYYALSILMGIIKKPAIEMYWSTDPLLCTPIFAKHMSLKKFQNISRYLHYNNDESNDKLRKIRPLFEIMTEKFQKLYRPGPKVSIDESLLKFKGRLSIRQCNLSKRARFGIKLYKCCDSGNGYIYNLSIYKGKDTENGSQFLGVSGNVVMDMLGDLSHQGRTVYIDNWYTSPLLGSIMHKKK